MKKGKYKFITGLDHKDIEAKSTLVKTELDSRLYYNFFLSKQITSNRDASKEHMQAFEYCYEISSIFEWLVSQSK